MIVIPNTYVNGHGEPKVLLAIYIVLTGVLICCIVVSFISYKLWKRKFNKLQSKSSYQLYKEFKSYYEYVSYQDNGLFHFCSWTTFIALQSILILIFLIYFIKNLL